MTEILIITGAVLLIIAIPIMYFIKTYNKLVNSKEMIENSRGQIATQVESRWDALTNLIQATQQYAKHETETLENVVRQRVSVNANSSTKDLERTEDMFQSSLSRLIAISEGYPDLKANEVYKSSMESVDKYEKNVRLSRMTYNDTVTKYNRLIITIPTNIVASLSGHSKEDYFESGREKEEMPSW